MGYWVSLFLRLWLIVCVRRAWLKSKVRRGASLPMLARFRKTSICSSDVVGHREMLPPLAEDNNGTVGFKLQLDNFRQMDEKIEPDSECLTENKTLTDEEKEKLDKQNSRKIPDFLAKKLDSESKKHWDLFYKRNETRFFKDRHWTTREFKELVGEEIKGKCVLLEVGCGVGNFVYPLFEENTNLYIYACDISSKAIDLLKQNKSYCENKIKAFQTDITTENIVNEIPENSVDIITLIFVLSAIDPSNYPKIASTLFMLLKPGGCILFRDYGLYDMTQLRFKPGHKISENFYMRQDGTRSYFFSVKFLGDLFQDAGFNVISNCYVHRRTVNVKEGIDVPRIFVQAKFMKPV